MATLQAIGGWHWLAVAVVLLFIQVLTGTRVFSGIIAGAVAVALAMATAPITWPLQLALFSVVALIGSIAYLSYFHVKPPRNATDRLTRRKRKLLGARASLMTPIKSGRGKVQIRDALWTVIAAEELPAGTLVEVTGFDKQGLHVHRVSSERK